mgnify:CR=1 FL=1
MRSEEERQSDIDLLFGKGDPTGDRREQLGLALAKASHSAGTTFPNPTDTALAAQEAEISESAPKGKTLLTLVEDVDKARTDYAGLKADLDAKRKVFDIEHAPLIDAVGLAGQEVAVAETACRIAAVNWYILTGKQHKQPLPGVGIRVLRKVIYDAKEAGRWCREHNMFMAVEWKLFERFAKDNPETVACVTLEEELQATIAPNLGKVLEGVA